MTELKADVLIVGGGVGGCAAAMAATDLGCTVILTEQTDWIGGQLTSQAVPSDEHRWIEQCGCTRRYRQFRNALRQYYRDHYPLTAAARANPLLNPGVANVSRIAAEPRPILAVLENMLAWPRSRGRLRVLPNCRPTGADVDGDRIKAVAFEHIGPGGQLPERFTVTAPWVLDATELGDLLAISGCEYVAGAESQDDTGEPHAPTGPARPDNVQAFTWCFPVAFDTSVQGADHTIEKPAMYDHWAGWVPPIQPAWPGPFFSLDDPNPPDLSMTPRCVMPWEGHGDPRWLYRRILAAEIYDTDHAPHEMTLVNWPQNDYFCTNIIDADEQTIEKAYHEAKQLSLSWLYWLQTEAPRYDSAGKQIGQGYPELYLRPDVVGTGDGLAKAPYIRESRRIRAELTVTENHVGVQARGGKNFNYRQWHESGLDGAGAELFDDSVGIGSYRIDLHMSTGGDNYIDVASLPFQIPLGALIPQRMENLLPACKNIGTTHISNGCYRLHPVEWNIGEAAGALAAFCCNRDLQPRQVRNDQGRLGDFQSLLIDQGFELAWPEIHPI